MKQRRLMAGGIFLLALAAVTWLLADGSFFGDAELEADERPTDTAGPDAAMVVDNARDKASVPALEGREVPVSDPSAGRGSVEVLVVGPGNVPLPGVVLEVGAPAQAVLAKLADIQNGLDVGSSDGGSPDGGPSDEPPAEDTVALPKYPGATTDADGRAYFADLPYDGTVVVRTRAAVESFKIQSGNSIGSIRLFVAGGADSTGRVVHTLASDTASVRVKGPDARLVLQRGMPLRLLEVSASNGSPLELGAWAVTPQVGQAGNKTELRTLPYLPARVAPGAKHEVRVTVSERAGFVTDQTRRFKAWVSPLAHELVAHLPQRPEAEVMVTVPEAVPLRAGKDWRVKYRVDARTRGTATAHIDGFGRVLVRGVPHLPGQLVRLDGKVKGYGRLTASGRFGLDGREPLALEGQWHPAPSSGVARARSAESKAQAEAMRAAVEAQLAGLQKGTDELAGRMLAVEMLRRASGKHFRILDQNGVPVGPAAGDETEADAKDKGKVRVLVRRADGKPAAGAWVHVGFTAEILSAKGTALFGPLQPGEFLVKVMGAGATFTTQVQVTAGETTPLELDAPHGGSVDVEVVDDAGRGLPFARVYLKQASGLAHADLDGDVQRIDPFVDHLGRRTLRGVEAGEVEITAIYGSRKASIKVQVHDQEAALARVVLPLPPEPKPKAAKRATQASRQEVLDRLRQSEEAMKELMRALEKAGKAEERSK